MNSDAWAEALLAEGEEILRLLEAARVDLDAFQAHMERRGRLLERGPGSRDAGLDPARAEALAAQDAALLAAVRRRRNLEGRALKQAEANALQYGPPGPRYVDRRG